MFTLHTINMQTACTR